MVRMTLNTTDYDVKWADVFPGRNEAEFSWVAANVLSKGFVRFEISLLKTIQLKIPYTITDYHALYVFQGQVKYKELSTAVLVVLSTNQYRIRIRVNVGFTGTVCRVFC